MIAGKKQLTYRDSTLGPGDPEASETAGLTLLLWSAASSAPRYLAPGQASSYLSAEQTVIIQRPGTKDWPELYVVQQQLLPSSTTTNSLGSPSRLIHKLY